LGFEQDKFSSVRVLLIGGGGLAGEIGEGLVRKGIGYLQICDRDFVEMSNLNRQRFFKKDLGKNKAIRLARNLSREGFLGTVIKGIPLWIEDAIEQKVIDPCDLVICAVDNDETRLFVSEYYGKQGIPVIFVAVSRDTDLAQVYIQKRGNACFRCVFQDVIKHKNQDTTQRCPATPAIKDVLKLASAPVLYAIDSIFMQRPINWNFRILSLSGVQQEILQFMPYCENCSICGKGGEHQ